MEKKIIPKTRREFLSYIAERIASERPNATIILNELIEADSVGYGRGYDRRTTDSRKFKDAQDKRRSSSWNTVRDAISDKFSKATIENTNQQPE